MSSCLTQKFDSMKYSLHSHKGSCLGQRHDLQSLTLTSCFYKNIYHKVIYVYFYQNIFEDKFVHIWFSHFQTQQVKSYSWFIFLMFDPNLVQNDSLYEYRASMWYKYEFFLEKCYISTTRKIFKQNYILNILLKCHYYIIYNKYNHILYVCMHT